MSDLESRLDQVITDLWADLPEKGQGERRLDSAIGAYLLARAIPDGKKLEVAILEPLMFAAHALAKERGHLLVELPEETAGSAACSFCGKSETNARLASGPEAKICRECVAMLSDHFSDKPI